MKDKRSSPDAILKLINEEKNQSKRGHLHIYLGYAAGVGKTYTMLKDAHKTLKYGNDTIVGYVEPHMRPATSALLEGLEVLQPMKCKSSNIILNEFDLDAALKRKPQLILIDELAHTNAVGCRHEKRYQDVQEILAAGIDVYTTVNVQHIESLNDIVASITGVVVRERIPDKIFDDADKVKLIDIEPQELLERLKQGKIYRDSQAKRAVCNFFKIENLTALREIALRRCADRINLLSDAEKARNGSDYYTDEHILVCISSSPANQKIIRNAARMAKAFHATFTALFVETPSFSSISEENKKRLRSNIHLAQQLGADIETTYGSDVALQIAEFARLSSVSKIVVGRSSTSRRAFFRKPTLTEQLIEYAPNINIYVIPDHATMSYHERQKKTKESKEILTRDVLKSFGVLIASTIIGFLFYYLGFSEANIITVYILGVLITAVVTPLRIYSLVSSILSVLVFNFCFTIPRFTLNAYDSGYPATFLIMFLSAFITSSLAVKIKENAKQSAATAYRTKILLDTNQMLSKSNSKDEIIKVIANQLLKLLHRDIIFYLPKEQSLSEPITFSCNESEVSDKFITKNEQAVATWVFKNNKHAGKTTATLSNSKCLYLAVRVNDKVYGVLGIAIEKRALDAFENSIVLSILGEGALALENEQTAIEKKQAAVMAKNEQLRANLLRSISHDLRTPLTSISGNAGILIASSEEMTPDKREQLYRDIYDDSLWLINLVENLLAVTKIENGSMHLKMTEELLDEILDEAVAHIRRQGKDHHISVCPFKEFLLVKIDARLIMQVIINIIDNALKYTPSGSEIVVSVSRRGEFAVVSVSDNGPGIPDSAKEHIFDMFYTAEKVADSRRSLGLGLSLCKSIIVAHGGTIDVKDNHPKGTIFSFTLPIEEMKIHE